MPPLPIIPGRRCVTAIAKVGFVLVRQRGSHILVQHDAPVVTISVPDHADSLVNRQHHPEGVRRARKGRQRRLAQAGGAPNNPGSTFGLEL